jgi:hypothetical protein
MNKYFHLPYLPHHPQHVLKGIIKGEVNRYIANTFEKNYLSVSGSFKNRLIARGYQKKLCFKSINHSDRSK